MRSRTSHRIWLVVAAFGLLFALGPAASAHSELERSDPPDGGMVAEGRDTISLWYTENVLQVASTFALREINGPVVEVEISKVDGSFVALSTKPLPKAIYELSWDVLSADDGHSEGGSLVFGVGIRPGVAPAAQDAPAAFDVLLRWIDLTALLLLVGVLVVAGFVLTNVGEYGPRLRSRAQLVAVVAVGVSVVAGALTSLSRTPRGEGSLTAWVESTLTAMTSSSSGRLWLGHELALVVCGVAIWIWIRQGGGRSRWLVTALAAVSCAVLLSSGSGHASELPARSGIAALAVAVHILAAGVWVGGLVVLGLCVIPLMLRHPESRPLMMDSVWRRFSPLAAIAVGLVIITGLYESGRYLPSLASLTATTYGAALLAKVLLLVLALAIAGANTLIVNPQIGEAVAVRLGRPPGWTPVPRRRLGVLVAAEIMVLSSAVFAAAVLTSVPTARDVAQAETVTGSKSTIVDDYFVTFEEVALGTDQSRLIVRTRSMNKLDSAPIEDVEARLSGPGVGTNVRLDLIEPGRYEAAVDQLTAGNWVVFVVLQRAGYPDSTASFEWSVTERVPTGVGTFELIVTVLAIALLIMLVTAVAYLRGKRRKPLTLERATEPEGSLL